MKTCDEHIDDVCEWSYCQDFRIDQRSYDTYTGLDVRFLCTDDARLWTPFNTGRRDFSDS
jgi:hypothetical protein